MRLIGEAKGFEHQITSRTDWQREVVRITELSSLRESFLKMNYRAVRYKVTPRLKEASVGSVSDFTFH